MLQQTRVTSVIPYYERFLDRFPSVLSLAESPLDDLLAAWAGMGYYSRARNLHAAARMIAAAGNFPTTYQSIRALPGVGDYTAAAVSSIAFNLPHAAVDGNVRRVLSRVTASSENIQTTASLALDSAHPGEFNQALMELGATVCLPRRPQCACCPIADFCRAREQGRQSEFPVKTPKPEITAVTKDLLIVQRRGKLLCWRRPSGRMSGFWELPGTEHLPNALRLLKLGTFRHSIMNIRYHVTVYSAVAPSPAPHGLIWIPLADLAVVPLSTTTRKALRLRDSAV